MFLNVCVGLVGVDVLTGLHNTYRLYRQHLAENMEGGGDVSPKAFVLVCNAGASVTPSGSRYRINNLYQAEEIKILYPAEGCTELHCCADVLLK